MRNVMMAAAAATTLILGGAGTAQAETVQHHSGSVVLDKPGYYYYDGYASNYQCLNTGRVGQVFGKWRDWNCKAGEAYWELWVRYL